jgi:small subunit ribosomal protein S6e
MTFKINISEKTGKTYKLESESEFLNGKIIGERISGKEISPDFDGYELEITGASDKSGFASIKGVPGIGLKKKLLGYGISMKKRPRREGKKKISTPKPKGLRLRKTVRGEVISPAMAQINMIIIKEGKKKLSEIFPSNKEVEKSAETPVENTKEEK